MIFEISGDFFVAQYFHFLRQGDFFRVDGKSEFAFDLNSGCFRNMQNFGMDDFDIGQVHFLGNCFADFLRRCALGRQGHINDHGTVPQPFDFRFDQTRGAVLFRFVEARIDIVYFVKFVDILNFGTVFEGTPAD